MKKNIFIRSFLFSRVFILLFNHTWGATDFEEKQNQSNLNKRSFDGKTSEETSSKKTKLFDNNKEISEFKLSIKENRIVLTQRSEKGKDIILSSYYRNSPYKTAVVNEIAFLCTPDELGQLTDKTGEWYCLSIPYYFRVSNHYSTEYVLINIKEKKTVTLTRSPKLDDRGYLLIDDKDDEFLMGLFKVSPTLIQNKGSEREPNIYFLKDKKNELFIDYSGNTYYLKVIPNPDTSSNIKKIYYLCLNGEEKFVNLNHSFYQDFKIDPDAEIKPLNTSLSCMNHLYFSVEVIQKEGTKKQHNFLIDYKNIDYEKQENSLSVLLSCPELNVEFKHQKNYLKAKIDINGIKPLFNNDQKLLQTKSGDFICFYIPYHLLGETHRCVLFNPLNGLKYELPMGEYPKVDQENFIIMNQKALVPETGTDEAYKIIRIDICEKPQEIFYIKIVNSPHPIFALYQRGPYGEECINISYYLRGQIEDSFMKNPYLFYSCCVKGFTDKNNLIFNLSLNPVEPDNYMVKISDIKNQNRGGHVPFVRSKNSKNCLTHRDFIHESFNDENMALSTYNLNEFKVTQSK